jgi:signal peptidase
MNPTLYESDLLEIEPYGKYSVQVGDVILFIPPQGERPAVHRVVRVSPEGIRTCGDNNSRMDSWIIHPKDVLGKVVRAARGRRRRSIYGGRLGWLWFAGIRAFKVLVESASFFYHLLAQWGVLRRCVPLQKWMRIIAVNHAHGKELKLILGRWVVGWRRPEGLQWQIRRPFRLFVDERSLPQ